MDVSYYVKSLLDVLFPKVCIICKGCLNADEDQLCAKCEDDMPLTYYWSWRNNPAEKKLWGRTYLITVTSLFFYTGEGVYKKMIHNIKYKGGISLSIYLGRMLAHYMEISYCRTTGRRYYEDIDYIIPIPIHFFRKHKRGYNQSEKIAEGISSVLGKEVITNLIYKKRNTPTQTRIEMGSKWKNLSDSFVLKSAERFEGAHLLVVDDVLTSGATIEECYNVLSKINNVKISLATLAYVE